MTDLNLNELREVAEAAETNAEWDFWHADDGRLEMYVPNGTMDTLTVFRFVDYGDCPECARPDPADARHIATFDPPTVLALLDRVAELEAKEARVEVLANSWARLDSGQPGWCRRAGLKVRAALAGESDE